MKLRELTFEIPVGVDLLGDEVTSAAMSKAMAELSVDVHFDDRTILDAIREGEVRKNAEAGWTLAKLMRGLLREALEIAERNYDSNTMGDPADGKRIEELKELVKE